MGEYAEMEIEREQCEAADRDIVNNHKSKKQKKIERQRTIITKCAGLISTMDQFKDKHPQEVESWIYANF